MSDAGRGPGDESGRRTPPVSTGVVFRWAAAATGGVLAVLLVAYSVYVVRAVLVLALVAMFLAVSLDPAVRWLEQRRIRRGYAVTLVVLVLVIFFGVFVWSLVPPMVGQGARLVDNLPANLRRLSRESSSVRAVIDRYHLSARLSAFGAELPARLAGGAVGFLRRFLGVLASSLTVLVLTIYFLADLPRLKRGFVGLFSRRRRARVAEIVDVVADKVGAYMFGNLVISLFAGTATFVCLELVGVPYALPLSVAVAITDLIPMIGATIGAIICVGATVLTVGVWPPGVIVLAFFIAYQQLENYLIAPRVLHNTVQMSSAALLLVALIGGTILGLVGAIMAIPIAASVKVIRSGSPHANDEPPPAEPGSTTAPGAN